MQFVLLRIAGKCHLSNIWNSRFKFFINTTTSDRKPDSNHIPCFRRWTPWMNKAFLLNFLHNHELPVWVLVELALGKLHKLTKQAFWCIQRQFLFYSILFVIRFNFLTAFQCTCPWIHHLSFIKQWLSRGNRSFIQHFECRFNNIYQVYWIFQMRIGAGV